MKKKQSPLRGSVDRQAGFTLIELIIVIAIIVVMGSILISIFFTTLRGTNKSNVEMIVRQNGNYAISQMGKMIRNARSFEGVSKTDIDSSYIFSCAANPPQEEYKYLRISSFDNSLITLSCGDTSPEIASNGASFIDTSEIAVTSCRFYCTQPSLAYPPKIEIDFVLTQKQQTDLAEGKASVHFNTSVFLRNQ